MTDSIPALELNGITRSYEKGVFALDHVDLEVAPGEVVGLLGANGAGKTTLMRIALASLHAQEGQVRIFGLDPRTHPIEAKRRVGYVSEDQALPPYLSVADVLGMHAELFDRWDDGLAKRLLETFELSPKRKIKTLSKGQARRVAVLCAIAHRPDLLLLDEPAGGFDPAARREFLETAIQFLSDEGSAILFSSHHMADVERIASRVAILQHGRKVVDESLDGLRESTMLATFPGGGSASADEMRVREDCLGARSVGGDVRALLRGTESEVAGRFGTDSPSLRALTLEDLFIELVGGGKS